jgi:hypothetical protein
MNRFRNLTLVLAVFASNVLLAQNVPPPQLPPGGGGTPGPGLPIDTNILILVGVAIIFGSITVCRKYKKNKL